MKVVGLETIRLKEYPSILFLQVHTDEGIIGPKMRMLQRIYFALSSLMLLACFVIGFIPDIGASLERLFPLVARP